MLYVQSIALQIVTEIGAVKAGFSLSVTVTVKLQLLEFPAPSYALHVTVVIPRLNTLPASAVPLVSARVVAPEN